MFCLGFSGRSGRTAVFFFFQAEDGIRDWSVTGVQTCALPIFLLKMPHVQQDWWDKWNALDVFFKDIGGVVTRTGDETVGEMWSLHDGRDVLNKIDPRFAENIDR